MAKKPQSAKTKVASSRNAQRNILNELTEIKAGMQLLRLKHATLDAQGERRRDEVVTAISVTRQEIGGMSQQLEAVRREMAAQQSTMKTLLMALSDMSSAIGGQVSKAIDVEVRRLHNCVEITRERLTGLETEQAKAQITPLAQGANALAEQLNQLRDKLWNGRGI